MRKRYEKERVLFQGFDRKKYASLPPRRKQVFAGGELFAVAETPELLGKRLGEGLIAFVLLACMLCWLGN